MKVAVAKCYGLLNFYKRYFTHRCCYHLKMSKAEIQVELFLEFIGNLEFVSFSASSECRFPKNDFHF